MRYCQRCILPDTRPNLVLDEAGNCNCATAEKKQAIDWTARRKALDVLIFEAKGRRERYDCVVPVSGGKDSHWQVITALEVGLRPLAVTWRTPARNAIGQQNLDNLIRLGVDHIDFSINPQIESRFALRTFERAGSPVIPMHLALFAIPLDLAIRFKAPLILWGENSAFEYGGEDVNSLSPYMNLAWLRSHGGTQQTVAEDWVADDLPLEALAPYRWPADAALVDAKVRAVFLGHFIRWDPIKTFEVAAAHGFRGVAKPTTGYYAFADIDDDYLIIVHHWLKWYKFGFTRLWDNLSLEIRNGRLSRNDAIEIVRSRGDEIPHEAIEKFCKATGITRQYFFEVAERFRDPAVWQKVDGHWQIKDFLLPDWRWS
jgi:N-acetyl sugar amidotransferase